MITLQLGEGLRGFKLKDYEDGVIEGVPSNSKEWHIISVDLSIFSIFNYVCEPKCQRCKRSDYGEMTLAHRVGKGYFDYLTYGIVHLCCKCGVEMCANRNEDVCFMLNTINREESEMRDGSIWIPSKSSKSFWTKIGGYLYQAGPGKINPSVFWARNPWGFLPKKFSTLEEAKHMVIAPLLEAMPIFREKLEALLEKNTDMSMSEQELIYRGWRAKRN